MNLHLILIQRTIRWIVQARKIKDAQLANPLRASKYDNCNHKLLLLDYLAWAIMSDIFASLCFFIQLPNSFRKGVYHQRASHPATAFFNYVLWILTRKHTHSTLYTNHLPLVIVYKSCSELFLLVQRTTIKFGQTKSCNFKKIRNNKTKYHFCSFLEISTTVSTPL